MNRSPGTGAARLLLPAILLVAGLAAGGCGVAVAVDTFGVADLRVEEPVTITIDAFGRQTVRGTVVNRGDLTADQVEVTLTLFTDDGLGRLVPFQTVIGVPVFNRFDGSQTLFPGDRGDFAFPVAVTFPPILDVDVQIEARFRPDGGFFFFIFTPVIVIA